MKQLQQDFDSGELKLEDVPQPRLDTNSVLISTSNSVVSAGTERAMIDLAKKSIIGKAKERPDLVKEVLTKAKNDGLISTYRSVRSRLDEPMPLGYSCAGTVIDVGDSVTNFSRGDTVACGGAGFANHAEINCVPANLCVSVPDDVSTQAAAFSTVGSIAMQGIRRLDPTPGERIAIIGLGLIGQLTVKILNAYGYPTLGIDINEQRVIECNELSAGSTVDSAVLAANEFSNGAGVDGVLITAATDSNDPIELAGNIAREQAVISVVGDVKLDVPRRQYYYKELDVRLSRSYGPGRYDRSYENKGLDYPIEYVRWTENRNMEEFIRLLSEKLITVDDIVTHSFDFSNALAAYDLIINGSGYLGVVLEYQSIGSHKDDMRMQLQSPQKQTISGMLSVGIVGAGNFAKSTLLPVVSGIDGFDIRAIATATGASAKSVGKRYDASYVTTQYEEIIGDDSIDIVIIATRHDLHAEIATAALKANKNVHVEKPPALNQKELDKLIAVEQESEGRLMVGYNRRFAKPVEDLISTFSDCSTPLVMNYRINAGPVPEDSWVLDAEVGGGRIIGEVCHFVDLLQYLCGSYPKSVFAVHPATNPSSPTKQDLQAIIGFDDGSTGCITYTTVGDESLAKERLEVSGGGKTDTISNFKTGRLGLSQDKGFESQFIAFRDSINNGSDSPISIEDIIETSETTFELDSVM